jgi:hypothetical protein
MAGNLSELSDRYLAARARVDELNDALRAAREAKDAAEEALVDAMVDAELTGFKTEDGVGISVMRKAEWSCPAENRDALYNILREEGRYELFSVSPQTLNRFAKDMIESGGELRYPFSELLEPYERVGVQVREAKRWRGGS